MCECLGRAGGLDKKPQGNTHSKAWTEKRELAGVGLVQGGETGSRNVTDTKGNERSGTEENKGSPGWVLLAASLTLGKKRISAGHKERSRA